jgi:hypothetical protein
MKNINTKTFNALIILMIVFFVVLSIVKFSVFDGGVDSGYYLSTARDWIKLGRIPNIDTYNMYTPIGVMFYAIPYLIFDSPDIFIFLILNLLTYLISFRLFLKIIVSFFNKSLIALVLLLSFLYNTQEIVTDIKLENLILVWGLLIIKYIAKLIKTNRSNRGLKESTIIGILCAFSILTKQFGGLSLIFSVLIVVFYLTEEKILITTRILFSFTSIIIIYIFIQFLSGLSGETIFSQFKGEYTLQCKGAVYGAKSFINLFKGIKYYRFDGLFYFGLFIILLFFYKFKIQKFELNKIAILYFIVFAISLMPFYIQVYPHYKYFGLPFIYFTSILLLRRTMDRYLHLNNCIQLVIKSIGVGMACISIYSTVSWSHHYSTLRKQKKESCKLEQEINLKLRKGALVHVIRDRKLWFKCGFVSPFPHTVGYGYLQFNCLKEASKIEMPNSFWVIGFSSLDNINLEKYSIKEIIDFSKGTNHFFAIRYDRVEKV